MARKKSGGGRVTPKKKAPEPSSGSLPGWNSTPIPTVEVDDGELDEGDLELFRLIRMAIDSNPVELLSLASAFVDSNDPRAESILQPQAIIDDDAVLDQLLELASLEARETDALAIAVAALLPGPAETSQGAESQDATSQTALSQVRERIGAVEWLPTWLRRIDEATVSRAFEVVDVFGDADQITLEVTFADGKAFCIVVSIDNIEGGAAGDGFAVDLNLDAVAEAVEASDEPHMSSRPVDLAVARARLSAAIELGFDIVPPFETETWPDVRPLTEWVVRLLPEGGEVPLAEPMTGIEKAAISERFLDSDEGQDLSEVQRSLVDQLLDFKGGNGTFDPLRWSPTTVAIFCEDWAPHRLNLSAEELAEIPTVLEAFIRFAHTELDLPAGATEDTLAAITR